MTVSKTLGGGMPLAAVITTAKIEEALPRSAASPSTPRHVSDPLPAAVGLAVLKVIERREAARTRRARWAPTCAAASRAAARHEEIGDVRGMGLLRGVELVKDRETREPRMRWAH